MVKPKFLDSRLFLPWLLLYTCVTSSPKTRHVCTIPEFNFITPAYRYVYTQWLPIPSVSIMLHINWSSFLEVILLTLQSHDWNNGTNEGYQWRVPIGDLGLLPLPLWPIIRHGPLSGYLLAS